VSDLLNVAGQYSIGAIEIIQAEGIAIDVRDQVNHITIYEDLFSPFISGNLVMVDSADLPSYFLNAGTDILHLVLYTPTMPKDKWIDRYFHIYKMSDAVRISDRGMTYIYHFVSIDNLQDTATSISKTFRGKGGDTIKNLLDGMRTTRKFFDSGASNEVVYTSNFWSPTRNISYISDHSLAKDGSPMMMFFENREGYQFQSLTEIAGKQSTKTYRNDNYIADVQKAGVSGTGKMTRNLEKDYGVILSIRYDVTFDYEKDRSNGMLSSRMFTFDLTSKRFDDTTFNMNSDTHKLMNANRFYTKRAIDASYKGVNSSVIIMDQRHNALYSGKGDVTDFAFHQRRISMLRQYQQHKIEITVFGRTDYSVGATVDVDINRMKKLTREDGSDQLMNPLLSGKYIVSAVCHRFARDGKHESSLELIRDSIRNNK